MVKVGEKMVEVGEFGGIFFVVLGFFLYFCCVVFCIYTLFCVET